MTLALADDLAVALVLAAEADLIAIDRYRAQDLDVQLKPDRSQVTDADTRVEKVIREHLASARPDDAILGEEFGTDGRSTRQWIVDPIDGTSNFVRGVPIWGALIALVIDGVPEVGVVSAPALGKRWWAATGHGSWVQEEGREPRRLHVSGIDDLASASVTRPPASRTIGTSAAMSHGFTSNSPAMSIAPSASSMYDQRSPNARVRSTSRLSATS